MSVFRAFVGGMEARKQQQRQVLADQDAEEERRIRREDRDHVRSERDRAQQARVRMADAAAPVTVQPDLARPATMDDRDVGQPGEGPLEQTGFRVGGQRFDKRAAADSAAAAENAPERRTARMADAMEQAGDWKGAADIRQSATQQAASSLALKRAQQQDDFETKFREAAGPLAARGWSALPEVYERYDNGFSAQVQEDGKGGATVITLDKDGKEVGRKAFKSLPDFVGEMQARFDPTKWLGMKEKEAETARVQVNADRDFNLRQSTEQRNAAHQAATLSVQRGQLAISQAAEARRKVIEENEAKIPVAVKTLYGTYAQELKSIGSAVTKAMAEGTWNPESPSAQALLMRQQLLTKQSGDLLKPFLPAAAGSGGAASADPLGLLGGAGATPAAQPAAPSGVPRPRMSTPAAAPTQAPVDPAAVQGLVQAAQAASAVRVKAEQAYRSYGLRQRATDPKGFAEAERAWKEATAAEDAAQAQATAAKRAAQAQAWASQPRVVPMAQP